MKVIGRFVEGPSAPPESGHVLHHEARLIAGPPGEGLSSRVCRRPPDPEKKSDTGYGSSTSSYPSVTTTTAGHEDTETT